MVQVFYTPKDDYLGEDKFELYCNPLKKLLSGKKVKVQVVENDLNIIDVPEDTDDTVVLDDFQLPLGHDQYYNVHNKEIRYGWDWDPVNGGFSNYKTKKGFLEIYNATDPDFIERLQVEPLIIDGKYYHHFPSFVWGKPGEQGLLYTLGESRFKVFVPPGTFWLKFGLFASYYSSTKLVARFENIPDCEDCSSSRTSFDQENGFPFERLKEDVHLPNAGGHIDIFMTPMNVIEHGGWIYVYVYDVPEGVQQIVWSVRVDMDKYTEWYENYDSVNDPLGLKFGAK